MSDDNQTHSRLEKLLLQSSRILNDTVEYEDLIRLALQLVCHAMRCEAAFVFRIDEKLTHRRVRLLKSGEQTLQLLSKQPATGITGWALETCQPVILNDPTSDPRYTGEIARQIDFPIRNLMVIPLESRGKTFGALEAINKIDGDFSDLDRDTLLGLSSQIAVSIDNSQLLRAARRQARERERLLDVAGKISGALNTEQALHMIMDAVKELVGFHAGGIFLIDQEKREFGKIFFRGYDPEKESELHIKLDSGLIGWVAQHGQCVWVSDVTKDDRYVPVRSETRSELVVPMSIDGKTIGVFNLESDDAEAYDGNSADLLQAFGAQAAVVIERTRLNEKIVAARALEKQLEIAH
ncbi:MAG TPA: GAF domain-containing protein, partial [candidate division Zixibacteria bacterium]|nr:GAF domain-containing protein [candidate division Zixibacteria bacterium]